MLTLANVNSFPLRTQLTTLLVCMALELLFEYGEHGSNTVAQIEM